MPAIFEESFSGGFVIMCRCGFKFLGVSFALVFKFAGWCSQLALSTYQSLKCSRCNAFDEHLCADRIKNIVVGKQGPKTLRRS